MTAQDIKILGVTVTYNNEDKIPYVMPYYERMRIDKLVVYDNGSTDKTIEMLSKYPFVEIRSYITEEYDENLILKFKTDVQHEFNGQYDWCISTYFDEVFYSKRDFREVLFEKMCEGKTYFRKIALNIVSRTFPPTDNGKLIHENVGYGTPWTSDDKTIGIFGNKTELFNMKKVFVNYDKGGCHECSMYGELAGFDDGISFFHLKFIDFDFMLRSHIESVNRSKDQMCWIYYSNNMEAVYNLLEARKMPVEEYENTPNKFLLPQEVVFAIKENNKDKQIEYIDAIKNASDNGIVNQYAVIFYDSCCYDNVWHYAMDKRIVPYYTYSTTFKDAVLSFSDIFSTTLNPEPWFVNITDIKQISDEFFRTSEKELIDYYKAGKKECTINGRLFIKIDKMLSSETESTFACYFITRNAEKTIKKCFESIIEVVDEIVVVDTGSTDKTLDIVKSFGSKVKTFKFEWVNDFSAARNFALSKVKSDYSLMMDADEAFTPELQNTIIKLKETNFRNVDWIDIWILHHDGTTNPDRYFGAKQIVKTSCNPQWKYRTHEKLYANASTFDDIPFNGGYVLHKHHGGTHPKSNYYRYAEIYYDDMNGNKHLSVDKSAHYYYYMFLTLKDFDYALSKKYLHNAFNEDKMAVPNEDIRVHLYRDNYISLEDFVTFELMEKETNLMMLSKFARTLKEDVAKNILLKFIFDYDPHCLTSNELTDLALYAYENGEINDFINITNTNCSIYGENDVIRHNLGFIENYLKPFKDGQELVIDCRNGVIGLASNVYYFSKIFDNISILCDTKPENFSFDCVKNLKVINSIEGPCFIADGNRPIKQSEAFNEFENAMYGRQTKLIKKIGG